MGEIARSKSRIASDLKTRDSNRWRPCDLKLRFETRDWRFVLNIPIQQNCEKGCDLSPRSKIASDWRLAIGDFAHLRQRFMLAKRICLTHCSKLAFDPLRTLQCCTQGRTMLSKCCQTPRGRFSSKCTQTTHVLMFWPLTICQGYLHPFAYSWIIWFHGGLVSLGRDVRCTCNGNSVFGFPI